MQVRQAEGCYSETFDFKLNPIELRNYESDSVLSNKIAKHSFSEDICMLRWF